MAIKRKRTGRFGNASKINKHTGLPRPNEEKAPSGTVQTETENRNEEKKILRTAEGCQFVIRLRELHEKKISLLTDNHDDDGMVNYVLSTYTLFDDLDSKSSGDRRDILDLYTQQHFPDLYRQNQKTNMHSRKNQCTHCNGYVVTEVDNGGGVCEDCGLTAWSGLGDANIQNTSYNHKYTKKRVHLYSKIVHFKDYIHLQNGTRNNFIDESVYTVLKKEAHPPYLITPDWVIRTLRQHKLAKLRKHAPRLAMEIGKHWTPVGLSGFQLYNILQMFRKVEYAYSLVDKPDTVKRKVFLSYPYTYYRICQYLDYPDLLRDCKLLKSRKLLQKQDTLWKLTCEKAKIDYKGDLDHLALYK